MQIELKFIKSSQQRLILIFEEYEFFLSYIYIESNRKMSEKLKCKAVQRTGDNGQRLGLVDCWKYS